MKTFEALNTGETLAAIEMGCPRTARGECWAGTGAREGYYSGHTSADSKGVDAGEREPAAQFRWLKLIDSHGAGLGVAPLARCPRPRLERAEAQEGNLLSIGHRVRDRSHGSIDYLSMMTTA